MTRERRIASVFLTLSLLLMPFIGRADGVEGTINRDILHMTLRAADGQQYRLTTRSTETQRTLNRLENGDSIVASGRLDSVNLIADLESIDFVGLRRIIGTWNTMNTKGLMQFRTYSDVNIYSYALQSEGGGVVRNHKNLKYTVSPSAKGDWVLFLSDETSTQMGFLNLKESDATISLLNSQTGDVANVIRLRKIGN